MQEPIVLSIDDLQFHALSGFIRLKFKKWILLLILLIRFILMIVVSVSFYQLNATGCESIYDILWKYVIYEFLCILSDIFQIRWNSNYYRKDFCIFFYYTWILIGCILELGYGHSAECKSTSFAYISFIIVLIRIFGVLFRLIIYHIMFKCCLATLIKILYSMSEQHRYHAIIQQMPMRLATSADQNETCAICLSNYNIGDSLKILSCPGNHFFHEICIDSWLHIGHGTTCPLCRTNIVPDV